MATERSIWRPNSFSADEWDRLSRDEQIRWWENVDPPPKKAPHPLDVARLYEKGVITKLEIGTYVFLRLGYDNVEEFIDGFPGDLLEEVQRHADGLPPDDDDAAWEELVFICGVCYAPWVTEEQIRQLAIERDRAYRRGVRIFREAVARWKG